MASRHPLSSLIGTQHSLLPSNMEPNLSSSRGNAVFQVIVEINFHSSKPPIPLFYKRGNCIPVIWQEVWG